MPKSCTYKVTYDKKDITADISKSLISMEYNDHTAGESDELSILLENSKGLWSLEWYVTKGDELEAQIIDEDGKVLNCGVFEIDETEVAGSKSSGSVITIKALGSGIKEGMRTIKSTAHENKTLREIAVSIAGKLGLTVTGSIPDVRIGRVTQYRKTDLEFLDGLAAEYGCAFTVKGKQMIFTSLTDLEGGAVVYVIKPTDLISWNIKDKSNHTYLEAAFTTYFAKEKRLVEFNAQGRDSVHYETTTAHEVLNIHTRAENESQAEAKAKAALHRVNSLQMEGMISLPGNILLAAGVNIELADMGVYGGMYHVIKSGHKTDKNGGYVTSCQIKKIG